MSYTTYTDRRLKHWLLRRVKFSAFYVHYKTVKESLALLRGEAPWESWPATELTNTILDAGLKIDIVDGHATISHAETFMHGISTLVRSQCLNRIGIVYSACEVANVGGVPIYEATIFGEVADTLLESWYLLNIRKEPTTLSLREAKLVNVAALRRDVYVVGRADVCQRYMGSKGRMINQPVASTARIRPTRRKAKSIATAVAFHLPEWDAFLETTRSLKMKRLAELRECPPIDLPPDEEAAISGAF